MQSNQATNTLSPRNTKPSFSTCPRSIFQTSKAGLLAYCVEQCSCGCAFSSFRSMTSASASQNTVMAVAPDSNRLPFSPGRSSGHLVCVLSCGLIIAQWILSVNYQALCIKEKDEEPNWSSPWDMGFLVFLGIRSLDFFNEYRKHSRILLIMPRSDIAI